MHGEYAELADGVLFEELANVLLRVADGDEVAVRSHVFIKHGFTQIEDEEHMADDASLKRRCVALLDSGNCVSL